MFRTRVLGSVTARTTYAFRFAARICSWPIAELHDRLVERDPPRGGKRFRTDPEFVSPRLD